MRLALIVILSVLALPAAASAAQDAITGDPEPHSNKPVKPDPNAIVAPTGGCVLSARTPYVISGREVRSVGRAYCWGSATAYPVRIRVCADYAAATSPGAFYTGNCNPSTSGFIYNGSHDITVVEDQPCRSGSSNYYRTRSVGQFRQGSYWFPIGAGTVTNTTRITC